MQQRWYLGYVVGDGMMNHSVRLPCVDHCLGIYLRYEHR